MLGTCEVHATRLAHNLSYVAGKEKKILPLNTPPSVCIADRLLIVSLNPLMPYLLSDSHLVMKIQFHMQSDSVKPSKLLHTSDLKLGIHVDFEANLELVWIERD